MGEFDKELEDYLSTRRRPNIKKVIRGILAPKRKKVSIPEDVEVYESAEAKTPFLTRLFSRKSDNDIITAQLEIDDTITDMKEVAKIALVAIKQLPDDQLAQFKQGPEFGRLKEILKKHSLIK